MPVILRRPDFQTKLIIREGAIGMPVILRRPDFQTKLIIREGAIGVQNIFCDGLIFRQN